MGFGGQQVNPTGIIRLSLRFGNRVKMRNLEVGFLVVDVLTAYNVILGWPTLYRVKAFEADDGNIGMMQGDQRMARKCYLVSIRPLVDQTAEQGRPLTGKKARTGPPPPAAEALVIHTVTSTEPERPHLEIVDCIKQIPLEDTHPDHTDQLG
ncbi:hypothetical protein Cgig2_020298 [Carnegiea gigantea]|uniref:Uncharacterized protein n=1 Tax=Carnegiea gigantea TaxID=171969 RepID=A0A9Q1K8I1_9CARY|nr:hypothetical protein Cgig2_020298 [Carnegiea gigantea]